MKLLVQYGYYHCAECHEAVRFEAVPDAYGGQLHKDGTAIGECPNNRCSAFQKRFRLTLPLIDVESLPNI